MRVTKIKWGDGLTAIDEGSGVIRVDSGGGAAGLGVEWEDIGTDTTILQGHIIQGYGDDMPQRPRLNFDGEVDVRDWGDGATTVFVRAPQPDYVPAFETCASQGDIQGYEIIEAGSDFRRMRAKWDYQQLSGFSKIDLSRPWNLLMKRNKAYGTYAVWRVESTLYVPGVLPAGAPPKQWSQGVFVNWYQSDPVRWALPLDNGPTGVDTLSAPRFGSSWAEVNEDGAVLSQWFYFRDYMWNDPALYGCDYVSFGLEVMEQAPSGGTVGQDNWFARIAVTSMNIA